MLRGQRCASSAGSRASASTPTTRRWPGRRGPARTGSLRARPRHTGGLNRDGDVVLHVPRGHAASTIDDGQAGWLRARVTEAAEGQPAYSASPEIRGLHGIHDRRDRRRDERGARRATRCLGDSEGVPGGRFELNARAGRLGRGAARARGLEDDGWQEWTQRPNFAASGPDDRHFVLDAATGAVELGPAVRLADGTLRSYGAVPPKGAMLRVPLLSGRRWRSAATSRPAALLDPEVLDPVRRAGREPARRRAAASTARTSRSAKVRGPIVLRTRDRAVTAEDFEHIAREAAPEVARVRARARRRRRRRGRRARAGRAGGHVAPTVGFDVRAARPGDETLETDHATAWTRRGSSARGSSSSRPSTAA